MTTEDSTVYLLPAGRIIHFCIHSYEEAHCRLNETSQASFKQSLKMTLSSIYIYIQQQVISCQELFLTLDLEPVPSEPNQVCLPDLPGREGTSGSQDLLLSRG
ncbi:unnamed protein product [Eretmochelys imbricata]